MSLVHKIFQRSSEYRATKEKKKKLAVAVFNENFMSQKIQYQFTPFDVRTKIQGIIFRAIKKEKKHFSIPATQNRYLAKVDESYYQLELENLLSCRFFFFSLAPKS